MYVLNVLLLVKHTISTCSVYVADQEGEGDERQDSRG